jgi:hypothetical protein
MTSRNASRRPVQQLLGVAGSRQNRSDTSGQPLNRATQTVEKVCSRAQAFSIPSKLPRCASSDGLRSHREQWSHPFELSDRLMHLTWDKHAYRPWREACESGAGGTRVSWSRSDGIGGTSRRGSRTHRRPCLYEDRQPQVHQGRRILPQGVIQEGRLGREGPPLRLQRQQDAPALGEAVADDSVDASGLDAGSWPQLRQGQCS